tara:strand:- start:14201 stop:14803 length:603 start_codon:yes stop_codon:yes gene_type:complete
MRKLLERLVQLVLVIETFIVSFMLTTVAIVYIQTLPTELEKRQMWAKEAFTELSKHVDADFRGITDFNISKQDISNAFAMRRIKHNKPPLRPTIAGYRIEITTKMLLMLQSKHEVAAIIAHEYGHIILGHLNGVRWKNNKMNEMNSDRIGIYLMLRASYNICHAKRYWKRKAEKGVGYIEGGTHPLDLQRSHYLSFPGCK